MATNLTDVDAFTSPLAAIDGSDPRKVGVGTIIRALFQAIANRTRYLANRLREVQYTTATHSITTAALWPTDVPSSTLTFAKACIAGDLVHLESRITISDGGATHACRANLQVSEDGGGTWTDVTATGVPIPAGSGNPTGMAHSVHAIYVCTTGGVLKVKAVAGRQASTAGALDQFDVYTIIAELIRPGAP